MSRGALLTLVALLLIGALLALAPQGAPPLPAGTGGNDADGRLALRRLCDELGFETRVWREPPGELPDGGALLWLASAPERADFYVSAGGRARGLLDPAHYARFLESGGTLVLCTRPMYERAPDAPNGLREFLADVLEQPELAAWDERAEERGGVRSLHLAEGAPLELVSPRVRSFDPGDAPALGGLLVLAELEDERGRRRPWAIAREVGAGRLVLLADDRPFANAWLREGDNALALVRLLDAQPHARELWFDEYAQAGWQPGGVIALLAEPALRGVALGLVALLALVCWRLTRPRPFALPAPPTSALSARSRAEDLAALRVRGGRWDELAGALRQGVARRLGARAHSAEAQTLLAESAVGNARELEQLATRLEQLERQR